MNFILGFLFFLNKGDIYNSFNQYKAFIENSKYGINGFYDVNFPLLNFLVYCFN